MQVYDGVALTLDHHHFDPFADQLKKSRNFSEQT
jgi:hypothetical protein